jgi:hypothetical protein
LQCGRPLSAEAYAVGRVTVKPDFGVNSSCNRQIWTFLSKWTRDFGMNDLLTLQFRGSRFAGRWFAVRWSAGRGSAQSGSAAREANAVPVILRL